MCNNCKNNGKTFVDFLTLVPGGTAADSSYLLSLTHYTCGGRKLCANGSVFPVKANLDFQAVGAPVSVGDGVFCQEVLCTGQVTYMPYRRGCECNMCPVTDNIYCTMHVPCSSAVSPTITAGTAVAAPTNVKACENVTNAVAVTASFSVATA